MGGKGAVRRLRGKAVAALLLLLFTAVLLEAGLRVADRAGLVNVWQERRTALEHSIWMKHDAPALIYVHRPDYHRDGVRYTERSGILRPDDVALQAAPGTFRIAVLGDSVAAAIKLPYEERVFTRLEALLNGDVARRPVELLNFGVNGYSTLQEAELLDVMVGDYAPDMLVLQYCMNDFHPSERPSGWFVGHSPVYVLDLIDHILERRRAIGYPPVAYWERVYREDAAGWRNIEQGFSRIAHFAEARGIPALLVIFPLVSKEGWMSGEAAERHARVAALGEASGFEVLDLLPVYATHDIETIRFRPYDTYHPNAPGHLIAAEALAGPVGRHVPARTAGPID